MGEYYKDIKGDTRSLDYSSCSPLVTITAISLRSAPVKVSSLLRGGPVP